jgi:sugar phosphate isomerase/epimerase
MNLRTRVSRRQFLTDTLASVGAGYLALGSQPGNAALPADTNKQNYEVGIYTRPWDKFDYRVALDAIAEAGFKHAGLMTTTMPSGRLVMTSETSVDNASAIGDELKKRGLSASSVYPGAIPVQKSLEDGIAALRRIVDNCVAAGVKSILMGGTGKADLYDAYYKAIAECCDYAAEKQIPITVKPHGGLNATGEQCRKCIEMVGHPNFSLWYDPGNIFFYSNGELDPVDDAKEVKDVVKVGMCIKDFDLVEKDGKPTRDVWITPGEGRVDFSKVLKTLRGGSFTSGALVIECIHRGDGEAATILAEAKKARAYVDELVAAL